MPSRNLNHLHPSDEIFPEQLENIMRAIHIPLLERYPDPYIPHQWTSAEQFHVKSVQALQSFENTQFIKKGVLLHQVLCLADGNTRTTNPYSQGSGPLAPFLAKYLRNANVIQTDIDTDLLQIDQEWCGSNVNPTDLDTAWKERPVGYREQSTVKLSKIIPSSTTDEIGISAKIKLKQQFDLIICRKGMCLCFLNEKTLDRCSICAGVQIKNLNIFLYQIARLLNPNRSSIAILHGSAYPPDYEPSKEIKLLEDQLTIGLKTQDISQISNSYESILDQIFLKDANYKLSKNFIIRFLSADNQIKNIKLKKENILKLAILLTDIFTKKSYMGFDDKFQNIISVHEKEGGIFLINLLNEGNAKTILINFFKNLLSIDLNSFIWFKAQSWDSYYLWEDIVEKFNQQQNNPSLLFRYSQYSKVNLSVKYKASLMYHHNKFPEPSSFFIIIKMA